VKNTEPFAAAGRDRIRDARYRVGEDRLFVTFDSGKEYSFARSLLECDDGTDVVSVKVDSKRFFFTVSQSSGNKYEVPWDRVLYEAKASYPYARTHTATIARPWSVGIEITKVRKARRMTQAELARAANILRLNLSRIEAGKHRPTLETLEKLAGALNVPVVDLIASR
jgi:DNA-binding XRE family transcriptional regulator